MVFIVIYFEIELPIAYLVQIRSKSHIWHPTCDILVNVIPKALKPPESAPIATSCSFINEKQIKTTNKS